jgi:uncharacterized protein (TIGR02453 family)
LKSAEVPTNLPAFIIQAMVKLAPVFPDVGLKFLRSLKRNNNRDWFNRHKSTYETAVKQPMVQLTASLAEDFARFAPEMLVNKASLYRIHRDTRFSKDKSPYKTHVAAVFPRAGLGKHEGAGFYFHIAPAEVLIGGGLYMPLPEDLNAVRSHIAGNYEILATIVNNRRFKRLCGEVNGDRLSRVPRGFAADHPAAEYLKLKQFLAGRTFPADAAVEPGFYKLLVETFEAMVPFIRFINEPILQSRRIRERQDAMLRF